MKYASVCSGVEAASLAWMPLGWEPVWFSEIEPFPCEVLAQRFPEVPNLGDMTKIEGEKYRGTIDIIVGGTPCQSFSVAGKQTGLRGVSGLALAYCELLATMRPRWFVWENVPGVFSTNGGEDFKTLIRTFDEIGYSCAWRVLDAQYVRVDGFPRAVPQRRRRVFVVGHLGADWRYPASVLFEPDCLPRDTPPRRIKGTEAAGSLAAGAGGTIEVMATGQANAEMAADHCVNLTCNHEAPIVCYENHGQDSGIREIDCAPVLYAKAGTGGNNLPLVAPSVVRRLTPRECERLMGLPDDYTRIPWRKKPAELCPDGPRYKACGNSMCVNVMRWIGMRIELVERKIKGIEIQPEEETK